MAEKLTGKQERFIEEYLIDLNATQAAKRAGYIFSDFPLDKSMYYVYFLIDPRNDKIFYVGKGKKNRAYQHENNVKNGNIDNAETHKVISSILSSGLKTKVICFECYSCESTAFIVEGKFIRALKHTGITNIVMGTKTNKEKTQQRAKYLIGKLMNFEDWAKGVTEKQIKHIECCYGIKDLLVFYVLFKSQLEFIANLELKEI